MSKRTVTVMLACAAAVIVVAGGLMASNMGFKLNYPLYGPGGGAPPSATGSNTISLPYNRQAGINFADDLGQDVGGFVPNGPVANVQKLIRSNDAFDLYSGQLGEPNFALEAGEGYFITMASDIDYIIVGSHAPNATIGLLSPIDAGSATGANLFGYPYHATASTADELGQELGGFSGANGTVENIQKLVRDNDAFDLYSGQLGEPNFDLTPGEAYYIFVNANINYVPSHF